MFRPYDQTLLRIPVALGGSTDGAAPEALPAGRVAEPAAKAAPALPRGGMRIQVYPLDDV